MVIDVWLLGLRIYVVENIHDRDGAECRLTSTMSCKQQRRSLCVCKGCDAFGCQLHALVRRRRAQQCAPMSDHLIAFRSLSSVSTALTHPPLVRRRLRSLGTSLVSILRSTRDADGLPDSRQVATQHGFSETAVSCLRRQEHATGLCIKHSPGRLDVTAASSTLRRKHDSWSTFGIRGT